MTLDIITNIQSWPGIWWTVVVVRCKTTTGCWFVGKILPVSVKNKNNPNKILSYLILSYANSLSPLDETCNNCDVRRFPCYLSCRSRSGMVRCGHGIILYRIGHSSDRQKMSKKLEFSVVHLSDSIVVNWSGVSKPSNFHIYLVSFGVCTIQHREIVMCKGLRGREGEAKER